jgi:multidrug transporter EmrE-like cation transporter
MAQVIYLLCALLSLVCCGTLLRSYRESKSNLLLWTCVCFAMLAISNILLFIDLAILPTTIDLSVVRAVISLIGFAALLYGLIWETVA